MMNVVRPEREIKCENELPSSYSGKMGIVPEAVKTARTRA
jgi:hypothetical protein